MSTPPPTERLIDLVAGCGALMLYPANAEHSDYLSGLSQAALVAGAGFGPLGDRDDGEPQPWPQILERCPDHYRYPYRWDLHEAPWTVPIAFFGGQFLVFSGGDSAGRFYLDLVLRSIFMGEDISDRLLLRRLARMTGAALRLSTHLVAASGAKRYAKAEARETSLPKFPGADELARLRRAVDLSREEFEAVTGEDAEDLEPLTFTHGGTFPEGGPDTAGFERWPIVRFQDRFVVASPPDLMLALRHALIVGVIDAGHGDSLANALLDRSLAAVTFAAELMNWRHLQTLTSSAHPLGQVLFAIDADKAAVITIIGDDLADYDRANPQAGWQATTLEEPVAQAVSEVELELIARKNLNEVLHIVTLGGCGRPGGFGLRDGISPAGSSMLLFGAEELQTVALSGLDRLELREFAMASGYLRERCHVISFDPIDEFAAWADNGSSYYFGDEEPATAITFDGSFGRLLRERVAAERDVHPAASPTGGTTQIARLHDDPDIPIYVALGDLQTPGHGPRQLVEGGPLPIWVDAAPSLRESLGGLATDLVTCLAYWLWQFSDALPNIATAFDRETISLTVGVSEPSLWDGTLPEEDDPSVSTQPTPSGIEVVLGDGMPGALFRADNHGERELMRAVLQQVDEIATTAGQDRLGADRIDELVELRAPLGPKKMMNLFQSTTDSSLVPVNAEPRLIREGLIDPLLDDLGRRVKAKIQSEPGPIPTELHRKVFELAVASNFEKLTRLLSTLSPEGLLEFLVATHEANLHKDATQRYTFAARAACFDETKLLQDLRKAIPESASAAVALRFLIEYCVAAPPRGIRPGSVGVVDEVIALASQVVNHGFAGDVVTFRLEEIDVSMLPSGRLGQDREVGYHAGRSAFLDTAVPDMARDAARSYAKSWERSPTAAPEFADALDEAARAEWGLTVSDLIAFQAELTEMALPEPVHVAPRAELVGSLAATLEWDREKVEMAIDLQALGPRGSFWPPPAPYANTDVYPWRFNRALSYVRKPLLLRIDPDGEQQVIWGPRHVERSAKYLLELISTERLRATSEPMKQLMTRLRQEESQEFVESVGATCRDLGWPTETNVLKIGGQRLRRVNGTDLGDVDVLSADPMRRVVHGFECKDLGGARTPAELSNELESTFKTDAQPRSSADIHRERLDYLRTNLPTVLEQLGIEDTEGWTVAGRIVVDTELLSPYVHECRLPVTALVRLREEIDVDRPAA